MLYYRREIFLSSGKDQSLGLVERPKLPLLRVNRGEKNLGLVWLNGGKRAFALRVRKQRILQEKGVCGDKL